MKFKLVEAFEGLDESNEYRKFFGKRIDKSSNDRGSEDKYRAIAEQLSNVFGISFVVHHKNGDHSDNRTSNIYLLPEKLHNSLFNQAVKEIETTDKNRDDNRVVMGIYASLKQINNLIELFNKKYSGVTELVPYVEIPQELSINGNENKDDIENYRNVELDRALTKIISTLKNDLSNHIYTIKEAKSVISQHNQKEKMPNENK